MLVLKKELFFVVMAVDETIVHVFNDPKGRANPRSHYSD